MTESQLNLGNELFQKLTKLKERRDKYFEAFKYFSKGTVKTVDITSRNPNIYNDYFDDGFPLEEVLNLYDFRIQRLNKEIDDIKQKFNQL